MNIKIKSYLVNFFSLVMMTLISYNSIYASDPTNKPTILIVEDNKVNLNTLNFTLKAEYNVIKAVDKEEALQKIHEHGATIKLIITDGSMPDSAGGNANTEAGIQIIEEVKRSTDIPILLWSTETFNNYKDRAISAGASFALDKPLNKKQVLDKVKEYKKN